MINQQSLDYTNQQTNSSLPGARVLLSQAWSIYNAHWKGILKVVEESIVSSDIIGESHASIVDLSFTKVIDGDLVKVLSWYDNEWGYSAILVEHVIKAGQTIKK